jgi:uncharacterized membrane protein
VVIAAALGFSLWAYPQLPAEVATHFDIQGEPNGWSSRLLAVFIVPGIALALLTISMVLPKIDPRRANYILFTPTYWTVINTVLFLLLGIHVLSLGKALGWNINMGRVVSLGVGGMLLVLGNLMTRVRPNWFIGIRTPWTLSSDSVWRKTHRLGGAAFMFAGACFVGAALLDSSWVRYGAIGVAIGAALGSVLYSYVVWRREQNTAVPSETEAKV